MRLVDFGKLGVDSQIKVNGPADVTPQIVEGPDGKSLEVRCTPGTNPAPGVIIRPGEALNWNLAAYGEIDADVANLSDAPLTIQLRVDSPGEGHEPKSSVEKITLPVNKSGTVRVFFAAAGGTADALDPAKVSQVVISTSKPSRGSVTFRVKALRATGKPGDKPAGGGAAGTLTKPGPDGELVRFDGSLPAAQADSHGTKLMLPPAGKPAPAVITVQPGANQKPSAVFKVAAGILLDLSGYGRVEFALKNTGQFTVHVFCRVENAPGTDGKPVSVSAEATLEPGASKTVAVSLAAGNEGFANDKVASFAVAAEQDGKEKKLELASIKATAGSPPAAAPPPAAMASPSAAPSPTPSPTPKPTPSPTPGGTVASPSPTTTPKVTPSPGPSATPGQSASPSPTPSPSSLPKKFAGPNTMRSV